MFHRICLVLVLLATQVSLAADPTPIEFEKETLDNGLRVIYAPMKNAPVVHVRVLYHVGSKDERPDRQGFAHMFEHMMFRGSAHVAPEEHMRRIGTVGGNSNAFTNTDQTCYVNTIPSQYAEMALYLEADRMASFKVSDEIFQTERKVVSEEWRLRYANPPYGAQTQDLVKTAFRDHSYRWMTIGDMDQLRAAKSSELQEFYNRYYVPNNACLIVAGDIDVAKTKAWVRRYFSWMPRGEDVKREIPVEPAQTEPRRLVINKNVPMPQIMMGWHIPGYRSEDHEAMDLLAAILSGRSTGGGGRGAPEQSVAVNGSRLNRLLINSDSPMCISVSASDQQREDPSLFTIRAQCLANTDPAKVEAAIHEAIKDIAENGVTEAELDRVKTGARVSLIRNREICTQIATELGEEEVFGGDADRVNRKLDKINAVSIDNVKAVAAKYLQPQVASVVLYWSDSKNPPTSSKQTAKGDAMGNAPVVASDQPIKPRVAEFPPEYPNAVPTTQPGKVPSYARGAELPVNGVRVVVMSDPRLPLVSWSLIMRRGSHSEPRGKEGLGQLTANMLRRGNRQMIDELESRGIQIETVDGPDNTRINGSCTVDQIEFAIERTREILREPSFSEDEFRKAKLLAVNSLRNQLATPVTVATRELATALWSDSVLGRQPTVKSLESITLNDVQKYFDAIYNPNDAILVISGDVKTDRGKALATKLLEGWPRGERQTPVDYSPGEAPASRRIVLIDNPDGRQSTIRMSVRAYDVKAEQDKYAGTIATHILSSGIDSRLGKYVRAEKGYTYGVRGRFNPDRHSGQYDVTVDTNPDTTGPTIEACFKVLHDLSSGTVPITEQELADAKARAIGQMVMDTQTISQQVTRRVDLILNGYPVNYYDLLPGKLSEVTADQVKAVVAKYVKDNLMQIVVVGPASQIKPQLDPIAPVEVRPMPEQMRGRARNTDASSSDDSTR